MVRRGNYQRKELEAEAQRGNFYGHHRNSCLMFASLRFGLHKNVTAAPRLSALHTDDDQRAVVVGGLSFGKRFDGLQDRLK